MTISSSRTYLVSGGRNLPYTSKYCAKDRATVHVICISTRIIYYIIIFQIMRYTSILNSNTNNISHVSALFLRMSPCIYHLYSSNGCRFLLDNYFMKLHVLKAAAFKIISRSPLFF